MNEIKVLSTKEIEQVSGAFWANVAGAIAGGVGGFYGSIISGGQSATFGSIARGTLAGMAGGALNPVRGFGSLVATVGGGVAGGALISSIDDFEESTTDE
jgi:outer membrane lipoprotein SlyB